MTQYDLIEVLNQIGKVSIEAGMTCQEFLECLHNLSSTYNIKEEDILIDDDKIIIIPSDEIEKPLKIVFETEEDNKFLQYVDALADLGEVYPMTPEEIEAAMQQSQKAGVYKIDFNS